MTAEDRELLAHAIWTTGRTRAVDRFPLADALMPVVEVIARRKAAEELRAAARIVEHSAGIKHQAKAVADICRLADAMTGTDCEEKGSEG